MVSARACSSDQMYFWVGVQSGAALFLRPGRRRPALLGQDPVPGQIVFLAQLLARLCLARTSAG